MLQQSQERHDSNGKTVHANTDTDTQYNVMKDTYVPGEYGRPHMNINAVSIELHRNDYIRPNAHLEVKPQIRSTEQLNPECFDGIGEFKNSEYHIDLDPKFKPKIQTPHKVALSIEPRLKNKLDQMEKQGIIDKPTGPIKWLNNLVIN